MLGLLLLIIFLIIGSRRVYERTTTYKSKTMKKTNDKKTILEGLKKKQEMAQNVVLSTPVENGNSSPSSTIYSKIRPQFGGSPVSSGARTPIANATKSPSVVKVTASRPNPVTTDKINRHAQKVR
jgi:hypothetical protein